MGVRAGLFCYSTRKSGGEARFSGFRFRVLTEAEAETFAQAR